MGEEVQFHSHTALPSTYLALLGTSHSSSHPHLLAKGAEIPSMYEALVKTVSGTGLLWASLPPHVREEKGKG